MPVSRSLFLCPQISLCSLITAKCKGEGRFLIWLNDLPCSPHSAAPILTTHLHHLTKIVGQILQWFPVVSKIQSKARRRACKVFLYGPTYSPRIPHAIHSSYTVLCSVPQVLSHTCLSLTVSIVIKAASYWTVLSFFWCLEFLGSFFSAHFYFIIFATFTQHQVYAKHCIRLWGSFDTWSLIPVLE